jgi:hypothetical protein
MAGSDTRQYIQKVMSDGASRRESLCELLRGCNQADDLLHADPVKTLAGIHAGGDFEFPESLFVLVKSHQAGGEGIVVLGAGFEA